MVSVRGILRIAGWLFVLAMVLPALYVMFALATPYAEKNLPPLKTGDVVLQAINTSQTPAIMFATHSIYSHVGIVHVVDGTPRVLEAVGPVREIPLEQWVRQGILDRITVMRVDGLSEAAGDAVAKAAQGYLGKPYDMYFYADDDAIYCSELVYKAFAQGAHIAVGKEERIGDLYVDNFAVRKLIRQRWKTYPLCKDSKDFEQCYGAIMAQTLVSPASQRRDAKLRVIYSNFGL